MIFVRDPILQSVPIKILRPTQITVGMREVQEKRKSWRLHGEKKKLDFLKRHAVIAQNSEKPRKARDFRATAIPLWA